MSTSAYFAQSYAEARDKFLAAAEGAGLDVEPHWHPLLGRDGERLALDVVLEGDPKAQRLLILSSAGVWLANAICIALTTAVNWAVGHHLVFGATSEGDRA